MEMSADKSLNNYDKKITENQGRPDSLNFTNEVLYMSGNLAFAFAYMMAPIALVLLANSFQPIFVLGIGILLTVFFPKISVEKIEAKNIWQKVIAITITGIGTYLLLM
jgi:hypothetical protein